MEQHSLLATKLNIPPTRPELVSRPRLIERLNEGLSHKLTLVCAPTGFGKTTLVSEWLAGCAQPVAWLSLDEGDNDPARFLAQPITALRNLVVSVPPVPSASEESGIEGAAANLGKGALSALQSPQPPPSAREMANRELKVAIRKVLEDSGQTYGSPWIYQVMRKLGLLGSINREARLMRAEGLRAKQTRRFCSTTKRNESHRPASNLLQRDFDAERPDQKWLADITYIPTLQGWLYLAAMLDLFGRRVVG